MLINELAKRTGISAHTIRFYEKSGLIKGKLKPDVKSNRYLHYDENVIEKLELIRDAKSIGFTLQEIYQLIEAWYENRLSLPQKLGVLDEKLVLIDEKIRQLREMKRMISRFKKDVIRNNC